MGSFKFCDGSDLFGFALTCPVSDTWSGNPFVPGEDEVDYAN